MLCEVKNCILNVKILHLKIVRKTLGCGSVLNTNLNPVFKCRIMWSHSFIYKDIKAQQTCEVHFYNNKKHQCLVCL